MHIISYKKKKKVTADNLNLSRDSETLKLVLYVNVMGVIVDPILNWKQHVTYSSNKLAKSIGIIVKVRRFLPRKNYSEFILYLLISIFVLLQYSVGEHI